MKTGPCAHCGAKLKGEPHFCPKCGNPTAFVTSKERVEWEVQQWRAHEQGQKGGPTPAAPARSTTDPPRPEGTRPTTPTAGETPAPRPAPPREPRPPRRSRDPDQAASRRRVMALPKWRPRRPRFGLADRFRGALARVTTPRPSPENDARNADVSPDDPWAYRACPRCEDAGWVVRLGGHAEGYRRYWCVRCWREFKSSVWLPHARKPFIAAAAIPVALVVIVQLL